MSHFSVQHSKSLQDDKRAKALCYGSRMGQTSYSNLSKAYRETVREKKMLLINEKMLRGKLNYELQHRLAEEKKQKINSWRQGYIEKYRHMAHSSDSLFKLTSPKQQRYESRYSRQMHEIAQDNFNYGNAFADMARFRVENIKQEHAKFQKLIEKRKQDNLRQNILTANNIKKQKTEAKQNLQRFYLMKKNRMATVLTDKIVKEKVEEVNIKSRITRLQKVRGHLNQTISQAPDTPQRLLFKKIL